LSTPVWTADRPLRAGFIVLGLWLGGFTLWSMLTQINGAVVASGQVTVEARRQLVQHPDGGVVTAIYVREGDRVEAGSPIATIDGTELEAQLALSRRELVEVLSRLDRLLAEIRGDTEIAYREAFAALRLVVDETDAILAAETALFEARRATVEQTIALLGERKTQTEAVIAGRERQLSASRQQLELIRDELDVQEELLAKGLTEAARLSALRREAARLDGEIGELEAGIAEARSTVAGFEVERLRLRATFIETAQGELRTLQPKEAELRDRTRVLEARVNRLVLRAPMSGTVLGLQLHTIGGVVPAGGEIAAVVPSGAPLVLSVQLDPSQIDRVHAGQSATIRFPNFNARTTPEVDGLVTTVSGDTITDPITGRSFYTAELSLADGAEAHLKGQLLVPGMPVEAFIRTDARSPASFLLKPLADYWAYAMREE
jgi:HlyD family type I secretion membrane fusion protein